MSRGGARNRSGPPPDPNSLKSARKGRSFRELPAEGYSGDVPAWPLPDCSDRERELWVEKWRSPQAVAWVEEPWRWHTVAMYVRWLVRMEDAEASAALGNVVVRFADQVGMTPAGLAENGWTIGGQDAEPAQAEADEAPSSEGARTRLRVV